jgi:hypothetical protein
MHYAYEYGIRQGLFDYIWLWNWDDTIYDNTNITWACYGTVSFIGDYITHHWGYTFYQDLNDFFNKTKISSLFDDQRMAKFVAYMSEVSSFNMSRMLTSLPYLVTRWFDAYSLRNEHRDYKIKITGPFTESAQSTIDKMILNATDKYNTRNYEAAIQKFKQTKEHVETLQSQDVSYWTEQASLWKNIAILEAILFAVVLLFVIVLCYRKLQRFKPMS